LLFYSETVTGDDDSSSSSYADEKDDYIDEFVTMRAQDTSSKCKRLKLRNISKNFQPSILVCRALSWEVFERCD